MGTFIKQEEGRRAMVTCAQVVTWSEREEGREEGTCPLRITVISQG